MLAKMGFKEGHGVGKDAAGPAAPVSIHVRGGSRSGLGKEEEVHRLAEEAFQRQQGEVV